MNLPTTPFNYQQPQDNIDYYYQVDSNPRDLTTLRPGTTKFGPEITFGHDIDAMLNPDSTTRIAIIKYAQDSTRLADQWKAGGDATTNGDFSVYLTFQQTVSNGMAALSAAYTGAVIEIEGMIWMQGESDTSKTSYGLVYETNLTDFITDIRATYGTNLPFVIGTVSINQQLNPITLVRQAQENVASNDYYSGLVITDTFPLLTDDMHFNAEGQQMLGSRFAEELAYLLWMRDNFTPAEIATGIAEQTEDFDSDGINNTDEFTAGTLPKDSNSVFMASLNKVAGATNTFEISYPANGNRFFAIESNSNLLNSTWNTMLPAEPGNGGTIKRTFTNSDPRAYIRVRASLL